MEAALGGTGKYNTIALEEALAISQHHDAVSGTQRQHVANDYTKRLFLGAKKVCTPTVTQE